MGNPTAIVIVPGALAVCFVLAGCGGTSGQAADAASDPAGPITRPLPDPEPGEPAAPGAATGGGPCAADADCVPAECCHPKTCTHKDAAPDCRDMMCTMDCRGGTLDCGGGRCLCRDGRCEAEILPPKKPKILSDPPPPPVPQ